MSFIINIIIRAYTNIIDCVCLPVAQSWIIGNRYQWLFACCRLPTPDIINWCTVDFKPWTYVRAKYSTDLEIPSETVTVLVGPSAREIEVGGCSVRFETGSFNEVEEVTIRSEINPMRYPKNREAIAPTLTIHAPNLRVPATVKLHTWCMVEGCEDEIEIMRFDGNTMTWEKIDSDIIVDSNFITFNRSQFSDIGAFCKKRNSSSKRSYFMTPLVYYVDESFSLALISRDKLMKKRLARRMRKDYGKTVKRHEFTTYRFKSKDHIEMLISCPNLPNSYFLPDTTFDKRIKDIKRNEPEPVFRKYTLENLPSTPITNIPIQLELKKDGKQHDVGCFHPFARAKFVGRLFP